MRDVFPPSDLNPLLDREAVAVVGDPRTGLVVGPGVGIGVEPGAIGGSGGGSGRGDCGGGDCGGTGSGGDVVLPRWMITEWDCDGRCGNGGRRRGANMSSALKWNWGVARGRTGSARLRLRPTPPPPVARREPLAPLPALGDRAALLIRFTRPDTLARRRLFRLFRLLRLLRDGAREDGEDGEEDLTPDVGGGGGGGGGGSGTGGTSDTEGCCAHCCCCCCRCCCGLGVSQSVGVSSNLGDIELTTTVASVVAVMGQIVTTPPAAFNGVEELSGDVTGSGSSVVRLPSMSCWVRKVMRRFIHCLYRGWKNSISNKQAEKTKGVAMAAASMELRELLFWYVRAGSAAVQWQRTCVRE